MIGFIFTVCSLIGLWKVFEAVGIDGWWAIVPFANIYKQICFFWGKNKAIVSVIFAAIGVLVLGFSAGVFAAAARSDSGFWAVVGVLIFLSSFVPLAVSAVISCITNYKMGQYFGKSSAFCFGLALLCPVFILILAFSGDLQARPVSQNVPGQGSSQTSHGNAQTPQGNTGSVQDSFSDPPEGHSSEMSDQVRETGEADKASSFKRCPSCGAQVSSDAAFCTICGQRLG